MAQLHQLPSAQPATNKAIRRTSNGMSRMKAIGHAPAWVRGPYRIGRRENQQPEQYWPMAHPSWMRRDLSAANTSLATAAGDLPSVLITRSAHSR